MKGGVSDDTIKSSSIVSKSNTFAYNKPLLSPQINMNFDDDIGNEYKSEDELEDMLS
jgi:hypothetical protein